MLTILGTPARLVLHQHEFRMKDGEEIKTAVGIVEEVLPNSLFRVRVSADEEGGRPEELVLAYLAGKMRLHRIRVLVGDQVDMVLDPYGGRARIVRRLT